MEFFKEINRALESREFLKAREIAQKIGDEAEKFNAFGIISYYERKTEESKTWFEKALRIRPNYDDALFNYSKVLFEKGNYLESWRYLTRINEKTWEVYDILGDTQLTQDNLAMALHYYRKAAEISDIPEMKRKYNMIRKRFRKDIKLAILCLPGLDQFVKDIANILSELYEVRLVVTSNGKHLETAYNWADIVWIEWANELAVKVTNKLSKGNKRILCRLHSYEALTGFPEKIKWENIDTLVLVANHIKSILRRYHSGIYKNIENKIEIIPNGVNLDKFKFKVHSPGFNIATVAHVNYKKAPEMWLQVIGILKKIDNRYTLHVAGDFQELRFADYFRYFIKEAGLNGNVKLYGFVNNVEEFLEDKNYLLSTSVHESFGFNIAEAMARGIKPLIHNFHGSKELWPEELTFNFIDEIPNLIKKGYESEKYRQYVEDHYSLDMQVKKIVSQINVLEESIKVPPNIYTISHSTNEKRKDPWSIIWERDTYQNILELFNVPETKVIRSEFINLLNQFFMLNRSRVLEVGSGSGMMAVEFSKRGAQYTGIDINQENIELSRKVADLFKLQDVEYKRMNGFQTEFAEKEFDIVFNIGLLGKFNYKSILKMLREMSRIGKFVVVGVPYSGSYIYKASKELSQKLGTWEYGHEGDFHSLRKEFEKAGIRLLHEEVIGFFSEASYLKKIDPSLIKVHLSSNIEKILLGKKNVGSWLVSIGTDNKTYAEIFQSLRKGDHRISFHPKISTFGVRYPPVSIVIPFFNASRYVEQAVKNLCSLYYPNFEVIFVNDGSTDDSNKKLEMFLSSARKRFLHKTLNLEKNKGPFLARYEGVLAADGEYIIFHNIDDKMQLNGIYRLLLDLDNTKGTFNLFPVSVALMKNRKHTGDIWFINTERNSEDYLYKTLRNLSGTIHPINTILPREAMLESYSSLVSLLGRFGENLSVGEDVLLVFHMILSNILENIIPVYYVFQGYEIGNVSSVSKSIEKRVRHLPLVISYITVYLKKKRITSPDVLREIENHIKNKSKVLYGDDFGRKFWKNFLMYRDYFEGKLNV